MIFNKLTFTSLFLLTHFTYALSWSPQEVPYANEIFLTHVTQGDQLPYYLKVQGGWVQVQAQTGCSSTPVTISRKRYRSETWNNQLKGGSSYSSSYSDSGSFSTGSKRAAVSDDGVSAQKSSTKGRWNESGSSSESDWYNHRYQGQIINDNLDQLTFYPCQQVQQ
ncbi:MAG: hypothetical protein JNL11_10490 [Bdellovibrionaceae bacterium]|nr:hypothetical protein [Pseudobdellovibrionaceae bacterium]